MNQHDLVWNNNTKLFDIIFFSAKFPKGKIIKSISKSLIAELALSSNEIIIEEKINNGTENKSIDK